MARPSSPLPRTAALLGLAFLAAPACVMDLSEIQEHPDCCPVAGPDGTRRFQDPLHTGARHEGVCRDAFWAGEDCLHGAEEGGSPD